MSKAIYRLEKVLECIEDINFILNNSNLKITQAVENKITPIQFINAYFHQIYADNFLETVA